MAQQLQERQVLTFLPLVEQVHQWSDRLSRVDIPLFSCYLFVRIAPTTERRVRVLRTSGVLGLVGSAGHGTPIPNEEIESLQSAIRERLRVEERPFSHVGHRVRIRGGVLDGVEGRLVQEGSNQSLIISIELLRRSVAVRVEGYEIEPI